MTDLRITVEGSHPGRSESFWIEIEKAVGVLCGESEGRLTRIARPDKQCNLRTHGVYELTYTAKWSKHHITLELR